MTTENAVTNWSRFSLRELLLIVGFVAVACVSLKYAGYVWQLVLSSVVLLLFLTASIVALVDRGRSQAGAIGLALALAIYGVLIWASPNQQNTNTSIEMEPWSGRLPTTKALDPLQRLLTLEFWVDSSGKELVGYDPTTAGNMGMGGGMMGSGMMPGGMGGMGMAFGGAQFRQEPYVHDFMLVGHLLWSLVLAWVGMRIALWSYDRRSKSGRDPVPA